MVLSVGTIAPDFTTTDDEGKTVSLSDFKGKVIVMYFYPKDDTLVVPKKLKVSVIITISIRVKK